MKGGENDLLAHGKKSPQILEEGGSSLEGEEPAYPRKGLCLTREKEGSFWNSFQGKARIKKGERDLPPCTKDMGWSFSIMEKSFTDRGKKKQKKGNGLRKERGLESLVPQC